MIRARNTKGAAKAKSSLSTTNGAAKTSRTSKSATRTTKKSTLKDPAPQIDLRRELTRIKKAEKGNKDNVDLATQAMGCTKSHNTLKCKVLRDYVDCLSTQPSTWCNTHTYAHCMRICTLRTHNILSDHPFIYYIITYARVIIIGMERARFIL